jgi:hypothetical protein
MTDTLSYRSSLMWTGHVLKQWGRWTRSNWRTTILVSIAAFVVGWVWNMYVMAVDLEGSVVDPGADTTATAEGHTGNILFWLLLFSLLAGLVSYGWSRGWRNLGSDLLTLPRRFSEAIANGPAATFAMLLWGTGISLVISTLISSAVSLVLGLVLLTLAATPVGVVLNFALVRVWRGLSSVVTPNAGARLGSTVGPFIVMLGEALGLFVGWLVGEWIFGLIGGVACIVVSVLLVRASPPRLAVLLLFVAGAVVALQAWRLGYAYADDGGWSECTTSDGSPCTGLTGIFDWLSSPGADVVIQRSAIGGLGAGLGALLGAGLGAGAAGLATAAAQANVAAQTGDGTNQQHRASPADAGSSAGHDAPRPLGDPDQSSQSSQAPPGSAAIPRQQAWPDISPQAHEAASVHQDAAHVASGEYDHAPPSGGPGPTDGSGVAPSGSGGVGASSGTGGHGASYPDIQDLLPEEPDRDEHEDDDTGAANPPEPPAQR